MTTSKPIARLMGPVLLAMGLGMVIGNDTMRELMQEFLSNRGLIYLAGILTLLAGLAIVNAHNLWTDDWRVIVTIFGWLAIVGGLIRILLPGQVQALGTGLADNIPATVISGLAVIVLGAVLSYNGYEHLWQEKPKRRAATARSASTASARPRKRK
ncbi:MAG: hypothetical protein ACRECF_00675 [Methyloceanibacter sp.]